MSKLVCDKSAYSEEFPDFAKPVPVGHFSKHADGVIAYDKSELKIFDRSVLEPYEVSFDLSEGFDRKVEKPESRLDNLLRWILHHRNQFLKTGNSSCGLKEILHNTDFVSWRGVLTRIASTLYKVNEGWIVCVCRFQDIYFFCEFSTELKKVQLKNESERDKLMTFWGHRFEHYVTVDVASSGGENAEKNETAVNLNEEFCYVVRTKLDGRHRLIFGAEVDAVDPRTEELIELKTNVLIETEKQRKTFQRFKSVSWWLQSFLVGIDKIICGFRNNDGTVMSVKEMALTDVLKQGECFWSGAKCFNFLTQFLSMVKRKILANDPSIVYKFEYDPVTRSVKFALDSDQDHRFLPGWFVEEILK